MTMKPIEKFYYAITFLTFLIVGQFGVKIEPTIAGVFIFNWMAAVILFLIRTIRM